MYLQIRQLTRKARSRETRLGKDEVARLTKFLESITRESAFLVLRKRQPDKRYLDAVHVLKK